MILCIPVPLRGRRITKEALPSRHRASSERGAEKRERDKKKKEKEGRRRALSNNHNVTLGCVTQKKSFSRAGLETYLSNIGLKLMPLAVAICYFYCSWLCIIFAGVCARASERACLSLSFPHCALSVSLSRANFNFYVVPRWGTLRYDFNVAYLLAFQAFADASLVVFSMKSRTI